MVLNHLYQTISDSIWLAGVKILYEIKIKEKDCFSNFKLEWLFHNHFCSVGELFIKQYFKQKYYILSVTIGLLNQFL